MIATVLLGVSLAAVGPDGPPKLEDLRTFSRREAVAGSGAEALRRQAPEDEAAGKTGGRPEHLGLAPKADPEDVTARGLLGLVLYRVESAEPDAVAARVRADADQAAALDEDHARRDRTPDTSVAQIDLGDEALVATPIHRFWKAGQVWAMARDLRPGDTIRRLGGTARVVSVSEEKVQPVFNLDVAQSRGFFIGASGALVHDNSLVDPVLRPFDAPQTPLAAAGGAR
jgi:hypothetical protein